MRKSKFFALALSAVLVASSLAGCGDSGSDTKTSPSPKASTEASPEASPEASVDAEGDLPEEDKVVKLYPAYDLGGETITLLKHNDLAAKDPNSKDIEEVEKEDRQANLDRIEKKYNVKLKFVDVPTDVWEDIPKEIISAYAAGKPVADVMDVYFQFVGSYVANDILYDFSEIINQRDTYNEKYDFVWKGKTWGVAAGMGGEGLFYNMDMIKKLGMEKTPAEMFDEGKWAYDDFYQYCLDMKSKMGENEYPLYVSPGYWQLFATAANGVQILSPEGKLNYLDKNFLETMEFLQKLVKDGLCRVANAGTEAGKYDTWGTGAATFDAGVEVAMSHRSGWQVEGLVDKFELGFVPYPWGPNVSIEKSGESGAYKTLSDNYKTSYFDGQAITLTKGAEKKADPKGIITMVTDLMGWEYMHKDYVPEEKELELRYFNNMLDAELFDYSKSIERWEPYNSIDLTLTLGTKLSGIFYAGESLRSTYESCFNADMAALIEAGYASEDVLKKE